MAEGTGTIKVIGTGGSVDVTVTVTKQFVNEKLKANTYFDNNWYGSGKIKVISWGEANIKMTIGGDTYNSKTAPNGTVYIPLKKVYKLNSKIKFELSKAGYKATKSSYIYNDTSVEKAAAKKKTIKVKFYNIHKGDVLKVKYGKRVYTKKVKKNFNGKYKAVAFKVKDKIKPKKKFSVKITNKYKQPMYKAVFKTKKGTSSCKYLSSYSY